MPEKSQVSEPPQASAEPQPPRRRTRRTRSLWDWLLLLLLPLVLIAGLLWLNMQHNQANAALSQQRAAALKVAHEQQQKTLMAKYTARISMMMQHDNLLHSAPIDTIRIAAQAETITLLPQLDGKRKGMALLFLVQTQLISNDFRVLNLRDADLRGAQLHGADLHDTYLLGANLQGANLSASNLNYAALGFTRLVGANLQGANLRASEMDSADLTGANLDGANVKDAQGVTNNQLAKAKSLTGTILPDGSTHP